MFLIMKTVSIRYKLYKIIWFMHKSQNLDIYRTSIIYYYRKNILKKKIFENQFQPFNTLKNLSDCFKKIFK